MVTSQRIALLLALTLPVVGCSSRAVQRISGLRRPPEQAAIDGVSAAVDRAEQRATAASPYWLTARLNRAGCDCPPWEVHAWGRWQRVALDWGATPVQLDPEDERLADGTRLQVQVEDGGGELLREDGRTFMQLQVIATRPFPASP